MGLLVATAIGVAATPASAAVPHTVEPGETLWSIAAANDLSTQTVAVFNGLPEDATVEAGQTIEVPTVDEGAAALQSAGLLGTDPASSASSAAEETASAAVSPVPVGSSSAVAATTASGAPLGHIPSPYGELHLEAGAAEAWNAMREESLRLYGIDIHPGGPLSAYRTSEEQRYLYELFIAGHGAPANQPGISTHETGLAVDVETEDMRWVIDQIGASFGWQKIEAPDEWWHVNYVGG